MHTFYPEQEPHVYTATIIRNFTRKKCGHIICTACKNIAALLNVITIIIIFNVEVVRVTRQERMSVAFFSRAPL